MKINLWPPIVLLLLASCERAGKGHHPERRKVTVLSTPLDSNALYFPGDNAHKSAQHTEQSLDSDANAKYSHFLFVLHEPMLSSYSGPKEVYRFTDIPSFVNAPVALTIEQDSAGCRMTCRTRVVIEWVPAGGAAHRAHHPDSAVIDTSFAVPRDTWRRFQGYLEDAHFWTLAATSDSITDEGSLLILEGVKQGNYHFVVRMSL